MATVPSTTEQARFARLVRNQTLAQRAQGSQTSATRPTPQFSENRQPTSISWRPADSPQPGPTGALASPPLAERRIPTPGPALPATIPPPEDPYIGLTPAGAGSVPVPYVPGENEYQRAQLLQESQARSRQQEEQDPYIGLTPTGTGAVPLPYDRAQVLQESQARARTQKEVWDRMKEESQKAAQQEAKKVVKRYFPKLLNWMGLGTDGVSGVADSASVGMSTLVTVFFWIATLAWWNVTMIYGYYLSGYGRTGRESPIIPPLTWNSFNPSPTSGKVTKMLPDILLHLGVLFLDILVLVINAVLITLGVLIVYTAASLMQDTYGTISSIVTGTGEFGFLGPEFRTWLGL